jgi:hypothetical protein
MIARRRAPRLTNVAVIVLLATSPLAAQQRTLRVITPDSVPVSYAWVAIQGQTPRIADEKGVVNLGTLSPKNYTADVRRLGYAPFSGPLAVGDGQTLLSLTPLATQIGKVAVIGSGPMSMEGFYRRWLARQNGGGSGVFIGPEEIDKRNVTDIAGLLRDQNGLKIEHARDGGYVVAGTGSNGCQMAVMLDGQVIKSRVEATSGQSSRTSIGSPLNDKTTYMTPGEKAAMLGTNKSGVERKFGDYADSNSVKIDQVASIGSVSGIEVYARTGALPAELNLTDNPCGLVVIWTGSRK